MWSNRASKSIYLSFLSVVCAGHILIDNVVPWWFKGYHLHKRGALDSIYISFTASPRALACQILARICAGINSYSSKAQYIAEDRFISFLPKESDDEEILHIFRKWMTEPLRIIDSELLRIWRREVSLKDSARLAEAPICYYKSWSMDKWQLETLIHAIDGDGY